MVSEEAESRLKKQGQTHRAVKTHLVAQMIQKKFASKK